MERDLIRIRIRMMMMMLMMMVETHKIIRTTKKS